MQLLKGPNLNSLVSKRVTSKRTTSIPSSFEMVQLFHFAVNTAHLTKQSIFCQNRCFKTVHVTKQASCSEHKFCFETVHSEFTNSFASGNPTMVVSAGSCHSNHCAISAKVSKGTGQRAGGREQRADGRQTDRQTEIQTEIQTDK